MEIDLSILYLYSIKAVSTFFMIAVNIPHTLISERSNRCDNSRMVFVQQHAADRIPDPSD
jgi:hypothetical protein